jgi:hypothetical protein
MLVELAKVYDEHNVNSSEHLYSKALEMVQLRFGERDARAESYCTDVEKCTLIKVY